MNLGRKSNNGSGPEKIEPASTPKVTYPGFTINDDLVDKFLKEHPVTIDKEITAMVTFKCTGLSKQSYGKSINFDVISIDPVGKKTKVATAAPDDEDVMAPKSSKPGIAAIMD